ncbi:MAG: HAD hydrolase family protein, partial [Pseudobutyrivibrio sp.]|nr:HAD hydrolase family protein [Pseudobutyrivibrio sp.]
VGDERNDISMIESAGIGVAVANARDELKSVADFVTENDNNHGAIAEVIHKFVIK